MSPPWVRRNASLAPHDTSTPIQRRRSASSGTAPSSRAVMSTRSRQRPMVRNRQPSSCSSDGVDEPTDQGDAVAHPLEEQVRAERPRRPHVVVELVVGAVERLPHLGGEGLAEAPGVLAGEPERARRPSSGCRRRRRAARWRCQRSRAVGVVAMRPAVEAHGRQERRARRGRRRPRRACGGRGRRAGGRCRRPARGSGPSSRAPRRCGSARLVLLTASDCCCCSCCWWWRSWSSAGPNWSGTAAVGGAGSARGAPAPARSTPLGAASASDPRVLGAAALARVHDQAALGQGDPGEPAGQHPHLLAVVHREGAQVEVAGRSRPSTRVGAGREGHDRLGDVAPGVDLDERRGRPRALRRWRRAEHQPVATGARRPASRTIWSRRSSTKARASSSSSR